MKHKKDHFWEISFDGGFNVYSLWKNSFWKNGRLVNISEDEHGDRAIPIDTLKRLAEESTTDFFATTMMPLLTILSMVLGILGSLLIGVVYLGIGVKPFMMQAINALILKDILTGLVKSIVFAWLIVITSAAYGLRVRGGAADVGRATTASVVMSIFLVILADSLLGLLFYFSTKGPI